MTTDKPDYAKLFADVTEAGLAVSAAEQRLDLRKRELLAATWKTVNVFVDSLETTIPEFPYRCDGMEAEVISSRKIFLVTINALSRRSDGAAMGHRSIDSADEIPGLEKARALLTEQLALPPGWTAELEISSGIMFAHK